jgi:hypothetical protein
MDTARDDRPLSALVSDLLRDVSHLVRSEIGLAKVEMGERFSVLAIAAALLALGAGAIFAGFIVLLNALVLQLAGYMDASLAALLVGGVVSALGIGLVIKGRNDLSASRLTPRRVVENVREDAEMVRERVP